MRNPKVFIIIIFLSAFFLLIFDLPRKIEPRKVNIPIINQTINFGNFSFDPTKLDIGVGDTHFKKDLSYKLGLDLQGGTRLVYTVDMKGILTTDRQSAFESARNIIERRINFFGVSEPSIQTINVARDYRIIVELPGLSDVSQAIDLIGKTAQLSFWEGRPDATPSGTLTATQSAGFPFGITAFLGEKPIKTKLTGKDLETSKVVFDPTTGTPQVQLQFTDEGAQEFADITRRNVDKIVAIVLDDQVIQAPRVNQPIVNGDAVISGNFTPESAKNLAISLNAGALPAPLNLIGQNTVGPSLGIHSLKKSLFAGVLGLFSIVIFMAYLYRKAGLLASLALFIYTVIVLFIFKFIPVTLTLAGIAGFILSIGMAVDANILIFERMKEELRAGKPKDIAQRLGFIRAWSSIRDSNIASLITCAILFFLGTGIVRGFAITLAIGILVSMFSAIVVTRNLLIVFEKSKSDTRLRK